MPKDLIQLPDGEARVIIRVQDLEDIRDPRDLDRLMRAVVTECERRNLSFHYIPALRQWEIYRG